MHSVWDLGSPAQGSHRHPLHWKVKSQPLDHPGSPWLVWATQGRSLPLCPSVVLGWIVGHTVIYYEVCWPFPRKFFFSDERKSNVRRSPLSAPFPPPGAVLWGCNAGIYDSGLHTTWFKILYVSQRAEAGVRVWGPDDIVGLLTQFCLPCSASY